MLIIISYLLFEIIRNNRIIHAGRVPNHPLNFAIRIIPLIALFFNTCVTVFPLVPDWAAFVRSAVAFIFIFWFGFDTLESVSRHLPPSHLGNSLIDSLQKKYPNEEAWFVWKAMLCVFALLWFYFDPYGFTLR